MSHLHNYFLSFLQDFGLLALFLVLFLETLGLPVPGETILISSSAIASQGELNIFAVIAVSIAASMAGDNVAYFVGRRYGRSVVLLYGPKVGITETKYEKAEQITKSYGAYVVASARFFVLLRQLNGLVAGSTGMRWQTFVLANAIGSCIWVLFWTTLTYILGQNIPLLPWMTHHAAIVVGMLSGSVLLLVAMLFLRTWYFGKTERVKTEDSPQHLD